MWENDKKNVYVYVYYAQCIKRVFIYIYEKCIWEEILPKVGSSKASDVIVIKEL